MKKDDILTLKAVILYILQNTSREKCSVYYLVKTAFYAQQKHFVEYGLPLFKDNIVALEFGSVPSNVYDVLKIARGDSKVLDFHKEDEGFVAIANAIAFEDELFRALEKVDLDYLSESAIECLNFAIAKVSKMDFEDIYRDTHGGEWKAAYYTSNKVMDNLNIAREGGAEDAAIEYLKEALEIDRAFS